MEWYFIHLFFSFCWLTVSVPVWKNWRKPDDEIFCQWLFTWHFIFAILSRFRCVYNMAYVKIFVQIRCRMVVKVPTFEVRHFVCEVSVFLSWTCVYDHPMMVLNKIMLCSLDGRYWPHFLVYFSIILVTYVPEEKIS